MSLCCLTLPWSLLYFYLFPAAAVVLTDNDKQSAEHVRKPLDPASASDFYALFNSPEDPSGQDEELKVRTLFPQTR
jgi:hypothetical protein